MRARDAIATSVAALAVTAAFAIVRAPLPSERPADSPGGYITVTASGTAVTGSGSPAWYCPESAAAGVDLSDG